MPAKRSLTPAYIEERCIPEPNTGCWLWLGAMDSSGYGGFKLRPEPYMSAQRGSFIAYKGPIPEGLEIDHLCRVRLCVNPDHLEAVTHKENADRRVYSAFCPKGHLKTGIKYTRGNRAFCKECAKVSTDKYLAKKRRSA